MNSADRQQGRKPRRRPVLALLSQLYPCLSFDAPLESQFRPWYALQLRSRVRNAMWIAMSCALLLTLAGGPFRSIREAVFAPGQETVLDIIRALMVPSSIVMLVVTYTRLYSRWFVATAQIVAALHGICFVVVDVLIHPQGYSLSAFLPLLLLSPYFLFGLLQKHAVRSAVSILLAYVIAGHLADIDSGQRYFDLAILTFASGIGATINYSLEKALRHNYLANRLLSESANRDPLTGIHNRRVFDEHITRLWQQAMRSRVTMSLLMIDLDHFKLFNDSKGHQAGDECLAKFATVLSLVARRPLDLAARYGGEEFAILLYDAPREYVEDICEQLHAGLAGLSIVHPASPVASHVTISIGAACIEPRFGRQHEGFIQLADEALYAAKEGGRNRTIIMDREYNSLVTGSFRTARIEADGGWRIADG